VPPVALSPPSFFFRSSAAASADPAPLAFPPQLLRGIAVGGAREQIEEAQDELDVRREQIGASRFRAAATSHTAAALLLLLDVRRLSLRHLLDAP